MLDCDKKMLHFIKGPQPNGKRNTKKNTITQQSQQRVSLQCEMKCK